MSMRTENLRRLLSAYFHEDWLEEYPDPNEGLARMVSNEPAAIVAAAREELDRLLDEGHREEYLHHYLFHGLGCYFDPAGAGVGTREWLVTVSNALRQAPRE